MATIWDSVIDQYGNAVAGAQVTLFRNSDDAQIGQVNTDANGFFEFNNLAIDTYRLQIVGAGLTTRIIDPVVAFEPYPLVTGSQRGLMSAADKTKLDSYPDELTLAELEDVNFTTPPTGGAYLTYSGSGYWYPIAPSSMPFALKDSFISSGGGVPQAANKYLGLTGLGLLDYSFLDVTPIGGSAYFGKLPVLNINGRLDPSLYDAASVGGSSSAGKLALLNATGILNTSMINTSTIGGAGAASKIPQLNTSGRLDPSLLPTSGGVFKGTLDLTASYVDPAWIDGDYGAVSTAGPVHATWLSHLNAPVPATVKVGDNIYFTGGAYSVVPSTTDLDAYLPRDGSKHMTGQLALIDQTSAIPTGVQAVSRAFADRAYQPLQLGAIPATTQTTSKSTAVALNAITGKITMHNASLRNQVLAGPQVVKFALSNNRIVIGSVVTVNVIGGGTAGAYRVWAGEVDNGSCNIYLENITSAPLAQPVVLQFTVLLGGL